MDFLYGLIFDTSNMFFKYLNLGIIWLNYRKYILKYSLLTHLDVGLLNSSSRKCYEVKYIDGHDTYIMRFPKKRGPRKYNNILDDNNKNITEKLNPYLGPDSNFHNIPTTPKLLGYKSLTFVFKTKSLKFEENDIIQFE